MHPTTRYRLDPFILEPATRVLRDASGEDRHLAQKPFLVLVHLVENRHRLVTRAELLEKFWSGGDVYDQALTRCLSHVRKALDDQSDPARYIETRWAEGYRYIGPFELAAPDAAPAIPTPSAPPAAPVVRESPATPTEHPEPVPAPAVNPAAAKPQRALFWAAVFGAAVAFTAAMFWLRWSAAPDLDGLRRIAVSASFEGDEDDAWLAGPLPTQVVRSVSRVEGLKFVTGDAAAIGPVDAMLDIALALDERELTLRVRLLAQDGRPLWTYESSAPRAEMMKVERHLLRAMAARFDLPVREPPPRARTEASYLHLLRGLAVLSAETCDAASLDLARSELSATLDADPGYVPALAGLAEVELLDADCGIVRDAAALARARDLAEQAARLDAGSARAQLVLGTLALAEGSITVARTHLDRAVEFVAADAKAHRLLAAALCAQQLHIDCVREAAAAVALAPGSRLAAFDHARALAQAGKLDAARAANAAARRRWPEDPRFVAQAAELAAGT